MNPAIRHLKDGVTLAVVRDGAVSTFEERGVKSLLFLHGEDALGGASVADRIVGRAAALLMALGGVREVYAEVLSRGGEEVLKRFDIVYEYGALTDMIINRQGTGQCPMECAVEGIESPEEAYVALKKKAAELAANNKNKA